MKINFEQLKVFTDIAKTRETVTNVKVQIADALYQNGFGIATHALAFKIYNTNGECELTEEECQILMAFVEQKCTPMIIEAFKNAMSNDND
jgi:hypothetical protein